jgi:hypothetical protein
MDDADDATPCEGEEELTDDAPAESDEREDLAKRKGVAPVEEEDDDAAKRAETDDVVKGMGAVRDAEDPPVTRAVCRCNSASSSSTGGCV